MSTCRCGLIWGVLSLFVGSSVWLSADEQTPGNVLESAASDASQRQLLGKAVAITIKSDPSYSTYLENVTFGQLGTSGFLVGQRFESGASEQTAGRRVWVAVDDISEIIEFENAEDLEKFLDQEDDRPDA